ncbi:aldehyde dehydrogenase 3, member A2, partial [Modicella reniformis]
KTGDNTRSGSVLVNDTLHQFSTTVLPFGGPSVIGSYHHQKSFDTFFHERSTIVKFTNLDRTNDIRNPSFNQKKFDWVSWFLYDNVKYPPNSANPGAAPNKGKGDESIL